MTAMTTLKGFLLAGLIALGGIVPSRADTAGSFDFYVLALSWSPTYCKTAGRNADPLQCRASKPHRFIVHGLWPQYERGYPDFCRTSGDRLDRSLVNDMLDIIPSRGLIQHQWRKHGSCSGLDPYAYFDLTRAAWDKIVIPAAFQSLDRRGKAAPDTIEKAFRLANPGLGNAAMAVSCAKGELSEVRICLTRDLKFRDCPYVDRAGCRAKSLSVTPPAPR